MVKVATAFWRWRKTITLKVVSARTNETTKAAKELLSNGASICKSSCFRLLNSRRLPQRWRNLAKCAYSGLIADRNIPEDHAENNDGCCTVQIKRRTGKCNRIPDPEKNAGQRSRKNTGEINKFFAANVYGKPDRQRSVRITN